jgi:hypothetical protein
MKSIKTRVVQEAIELTELDIRISVGYEGRAMYGKLCDGIIVKSFGDAFLFFLALGQVASHEMAEMPLDSDEFDELEENVIEMTQQARTDNLGKDIIVYFPGWTFN